MRGGTRKRQRAGKGPRTWYFAGGIYEHGKRSDPVSLVMYKGTAHANPACMQGVDTEINYLCLTNTWIGGWEAMHKIPICAGFPTEDAHMEFADRHGNVRYPDPSLQFYTARFRFPDPCAVGFHVRWWSDETHHEQTGHREFSWWAGAIHHEHRRRTTHQVDMDWDDARVIAIKHAHTTHCTQRHWRVHPDTKGKFGRYVNSGMISRISVAQRIDPGGCRGQ